MQGACIFPEKTPVEQRCRKALSYCFVIIALFMIFGPASAEYILPDSLLTDSIVIAGNSGIPIVAPDTFSQVPPGSSSQASAGKPWAAGLSPESAGNLELRIEETLYAFRYDERSGSWSAQNHAQQSSIRADRSGAVTIASANGSIGMQLTALGRDGNYWRAGPGTPGGDGTRLTIQRDGNTEWYVNDNAGIEHGMDIAARTDGTGPLRAIFSLSGDLTPSLAGQDVVFSDEGGPVFQYTGLIAQDARGNHLPARLILDGTTLSWEIDDDGAHYPIRIDPVVTQVKILSASHGVIKDYFGTSVAVSGDTAIIGSPHANSGDFALAGKAYVLSRNQGGANNWGEVKILTASDAAAKNLFGDSVAIDGETVLVGSPFADSGGHEDAGKAYVFNKDQGGVNNWGQVAIISASDKADSDLFGYAVAVDGTTAIVGASDADSGGTCRGQAYVFSKDHGGENTWGQVKILTASDAADDDSFGYSVAIDGDTALVGSPEAGFEGCADAGKAYVFARNQGGANNWGEVKILTPSDSDTHNFFGYSVAIDGDTALIGSPEADPGGREDAGQAYVFTRNQGSANNWGQVKILTASDAADNYYFGESVAVDGDTALVGSPKADSGGREEAGKAYVFKKDQSGVNNWGEVKILTTSDATKSDYFGESVAVDGDTALGGSPGPDSWEDNVKTGKAYVFAFSPSPPPPQPTPPTSDSDNPANVQPQQAPLQQQLHTMDVNVGGNSAIRSVGVSGTGISGLIVTAMTRPGPGPNIEPPAGNVYQYIEIVPARFTTIDEATITFTIPDAWLEEHGFSPENIVLYHYENNKWVALPTTVSGTQNGIVTFTATSPGFSLFAIAGTPGSPAAPEVKTFGELAASPRPAAESPPGQRAPVVTQTPAAPAIIPASFGIPLLPLLALTGIIILAAGGFVVRRWWMRRQNPALFEEYD